MAGSALEEGLHGAEVAWEAAAPTGLDQSEAQIAAAAKQRAVVAHLSEVGLAVGLIDRLEPSRPCILDHMRPKLLGLADHDRLGVVLDLIGHQRGMEAAHHHRHAATAELARDLIGAL